MKRRLLIVAIFLLAGMVVNVAVAWGCAVWMDPRLQDATERVGGEWRAEGYRGWFIWEHRTTGAVRIISRWFDKGVPFGIGGGIPEDPGRPLVPAWAPFVAPDYEPPTNASHYWIATARGWPLCSLVGAVHMAKRWGPGGYETDVDMLWAFVFDEGRVADPNKHWDLRLVPYRPLVIPFAINTVFYAALLWLPFVVRRWRRVRRGLCPTCAYPMGPSDVCSECGKPLPGRMAGTA